MTVAIAVDIAFRTAAAGAFALIKQDFGAGAAGAGFAHHPEVAFLAHADDAIRGNIHLFVPDFKRLIVIFINRDPQFFLGKFDDINQIFPRPGDGFLLEIIAEGKIAEHFEKGMMTGGNADIFQVVVLSAGARAFLAGCRPGVAPVFQSQKRVFELYHARVGEKQSRIVLGNQRRTCHHGVPLAFEIF